MEHRFVVVGGSAVLLSMAAACGARSDTVSDEELGQTDCAAENQRVQDDCRKRCSATPSAAPQGLSPQQVNLTACVDACISEATKQCEASATCRCSLALTKLASCAPLLR